MKTQNKVQLIGYLGADPKIFTTASGQQFATMRLATDHLVRSGEHVKAKITTWHSIKVWGSTWMPFVQNHLLKGSHIMVEGPIAHSMYVDKTGKNCQWSEIKAVHIMNLDR